MTQVTLHPTPRARDVVREQVRVVGLGLRREALVAAAVLGVITVVIAIDIVRGSAATWFDSDEWLPLGLISFLVPFAVWRTEKRFGPAFLWTLPVDRRRLALAKVFAGWVWLMSALAFFVSWQVTLALLSGVTHARTVASIAFPGTTAMYLFGSALVLGLRHPLRWLLGTLGVFFLLGMFNEALARGPYGLRTLLRSGALYAAVEQAVNVWQNMPDPAQWAIAAVLWLGSGLAALWAALSRHGERRRH
jgi:hypothetical protein